MRRDLLPRAGSALFLGACITLTMLHAGCARPVGSVTGKITYQGKALKGGSVCFVSTDGGVSFSAGITDDGTYTIPELQGGSYKVCVETSSQKPAQSGNQANYGNPASSKYGGGKSGSSTPPTAPLIPKGAKTGPPPDAAIPEGYTPSDPAAMASVAAGKRYVHIDEKYAKPDTTDITFTSRAGPRPSTST